MSIAIVGAGLAGLLAANMLKRHYPVVYERQFKIPNNHSAILRFRSGQIGDLVGLPFKKVTMIKSYAPHNNPIADALSYSRKTNGTYRSDRSIVAGLVQAERFIAPDKFIEFLSSNIAPGELVLGKPFEIKPGASDFQQATVSTIPMPALMDMLGYDAGGVFEEPIVGANIVASVSDCDAYVSLLIPDPQVPVSRISLTGDRLILEMVLPQDQKRRDAAIDDWKADALGITKIWAARYLGITTPIYNASVLVQPYAKIAPIPDDIRKAFMYHATDKYNIFSLGRYATWRPGLLLDDLVKDIRLIDGWIRERSRYNVAAHRS